MRKLTRKSILIYIIVPDGFWELKAVGYVAVRIASKLAFSGKAVKRDMSDWKADPL